MQVNVTHPTRPDADALPVEIVERKGLGHPDSLADRAAEELSIALSSHYLDTTGAIQHHNVDKCVLVGGKAEPAFGGGKVLEPVELILVGRAAPLQSSEPMEDFVRRITREWLEKDFPLLAGEDRIRIETRIRPGSVDLVANFKASQDVPRANDTSFGVGYWPLSDLERIVLAAEHALNDPEFKREHPEIGTDIKIMGLRQENEIDLTVACAMVDRHLADQRAYEEAKQLVQSVVLAQAEREAPDRECKVSVNTADNGAGLFLTVTGSSVEAGDDGQVGRGNRPNGLITPYRPMTLEAACGKNPVSHVGKLYSVMAQHIAREVCKLEGVRNASCYLLSRIGAPIDEPNEVNVEVEAEQGAAALENDIRALVEATLSDWRRFQRGFLEHEWSLF